LGKSGDRQHDALKRAHLRPQAEAEPLSPNVHELKTARLVAFIVPGPGRGGCIARRDRANEVTLGNRAGFSGGLPGAPAGDTTEANSRA
jgi:hypothetical protein